MAAPARWCRFESALMFEMKTWCVEAAMKVVLVRTVVVEQVGFLRECCIRMESTMSSGSQCNGGLRCVRFPAWW